ncbi:MAG TPA: CaiB/BaiF CoA-transferase family protein [Acidimicrobiia bacterium]|jgi:alpha-methylacyl-CoA racemase|nr:CaiB/BaiF CoA-transferase family protein [Acidimicrobiia bacterium]
MGPLTGLRVVEIEAIGPVPFCAALLSDLGAEIIRIDRRGGPSDPLRLLMGRNRRSVALDLKHPDGTSAAKRVIGTADVLLEGMRPGVMERLGLGPEVCMDANPQLVYGRMTGWGQHGPLAERAGHDIDYIALTGALHSVGAADGPPPPPLNLFGDFGGGSLYLALGVLAALHERTTSGRGQVVDAAMVDGATSLLTMAYEMRAIGLWGDERESNLLDGGAPFYRCYATADGKYMAVGAIEPPFYAALLEGLELEPDDLPSQFDRGRWAELHRRFEDCFRTRTQAEWERVFEGSDACVAPVLSMAEAPQHPHLVARGTFVTEDGPPRPAPAPRFDRTPASRRATPAPAPGADTVAVLAEVGFEPAAIAALRQKGVID